MISKTVFRAVEKAGKAAAKSAQGMTEENLREAVEGISSALLGHGIDAGERLCLNEERKAFRAELASRLPSAE